MLVSNCANGEISKRHLKNITKNFSSLVSLGIWEKKDIDDKYILGTKCSCISVLDPSLINCVTLRKFSLSAFSISVPSPIKSGKHHYLPHKLWWLKEIKRESERVFYGMFSMFSTVLNLEFGSQEALDKRWPYCSSKTQLSYA